MLSRILLGAVGVTLALSGSAQAAVTTIDDVLVVTGTAGADQITFSAPSRATFEVRTGSERVVVNRTRVSRVVVHGGLGADRLDLGPLTNLPDVVVDLGQDTAADELKMTGTAGDDELRVAGSNVTGLASRVELVAADRRDRLAFATLAGRDTVDAATAAGPRIQADGGLGDDVLIGGGEADVLAGGDGGDFIVGGGGDDVAAGGRGDDVLRGDAGADVLDGGLDDDVLIGRIGTDILLNGEVLLND